MFSNLTQSLMVTPVTIQTQRINLSNGLQGTMFTKGGARVGNPLSFTPKYGQRKTHVVMSAQSESSKDNILS